MPPKVAEKPSSSTVSKPAPNVDNDEMRIAWRYNSLDKVDSEQGAGSQKDGNNLYTFDLSQSVDDSALDSLDITLFGLKDAEVAANENSIFYNPAYVALIKKLQKKLSEPAFETSSQTVSSSEKNLLRTCIESFGSPIWYNEHFAEDVCLLLTILKAAVRVSLSVCCITIPTHLFKHIVSCGLYKNQCHQCVFMNVFFYFFFNAGSNISPSCSEFGRLFN